MRDSRDACTPATGWRRMATIKQLPADVVNKIAAGEVIERPASVVKELMENSLDAGATQIEIAIERGGAESIRLADNGCGMESDALPLAVAAHATSKIRDAEDLFRVATLGFRGEALASIAAVSQLTLTSRAADASEGATLEVRGGVAGDVVPSGCPPGTTVEVRQLFLNTPVRRKFLRTTQTEMGHITDAVVRLALAHPQVRFLLTHNNKRVHDLPAGETWLDRIARLFGRDMADSLIAVESEDAGIRLNGFVAPPNHSRGNQRLQYLFLNGRFIRDRALQHALSEAYRGLLMHGRYPIAFLRLDMPPEAVDVNVHPSKLEVRFQESGRIYSQLLGTLRTRFLAADLTVPLNAERGNTTNDPSSDAQAEQARRELAEWAQGQLQNVEDATHGADSFRTLPEEAASASPLSLNRVSPHFDAERARAEEERRARDEGVFAFGNRNSDSPDSAQPETAAPSTRDSISSAAAPTQNRPETANELSDDHARAIQVHDRYLIAESREGVLVIDQHALHERILYERLRARTLEDKLESQQLLVPEPLDLLPTESAALLDHRDLLAQLGLNVEPFGGDTVLLTSFPAMLSNLRPQEVLRALAAQLVDGAGTPDARDLVDELLHLMACKAAIKAGDRLTPEEVTALLEQRHLVADAHHCPHGRPTALVFTREELDRQFKRT